MRSAADLILELREEAESGKWESVGLIVEFPAEKGKADRFIRSNSVNPLVELNEAIRCGGKPLGFLSQPLTNLGEVCTRLLREREGDQAAEEYLRQFAAECGGSRIKNGWLTVGGGIQ
jgi:hypothetical protein